MSKVEAGIWGWLTKRYTNRKLALRMARYFDRPDKFWENLKESIKETCEAGAEEAAAAEVRGWLLETEWHADILSQTPVPKRWTKGEKLFSRLADVYRRDVLDLLPDLLLECRWHRNTGTTATPLDQPTDNDDRPAVADTAARPFGSSIRVKVYRYFADPATSHCRPASTIPVAAVFGQSSANPTGRILPLDIYLMPPGHGTVNLHPLMTLSGWEDFDDSFLQSAGEAWHAALSQAGLSNARREISIGLYFPPVPDLPDYQLRGASAGGALALGFSRVLCGMRYDPRVLVIATIESGGRLGQVFDEPAGEHETGKTCLQLKADGIFKHNADLPKYSPRRIDTVAVVERQEGEMRAALLKAGCDENEVRVQAIRRS